MNKEQTELFAALRPVVTAFEELNVPYYLGGSMASGVFGEPRQTLDADMVAALLGRHVPLLAGRLAGEYYADEPTMLRAIEHQASLHEWAARLNLTDLLRRALDDAGLPPEP